MSSSGRNKKGMFIKGHKHSPETILKISTSKKGRKGHVCWTKGLTKETDSRVAQMAETKRNAVYKSRPHRKGMRVSIETEFKKGEHRSPATEFKKGVIAKERHHFWKGGITPENDKIRKSDEYNTWRVQVYYRDYYTCQDCGIHCEPFNIVAHHLKSFALFPTERLNVANGITLCRKCHFNRHHRSGDKCQLVA